MALATDWLIISYNQIADVSSHIRCHQLLFVLNEYFNHQIVHIVTANQPDIQEKEASLLTEWPGIRVWPLL